MGLPNIVISFTAKASTAVARSERGIVCLVVTDATKTASPVVITRASEIVATDWTADNAKYIAEALEGGASKVVVVRGSENTFTDGTLTGINFNWIASPVSGNQTKIVTFVKEMNGTVTGRKVKAVVYNQTANDAHIVNFTNTKVTRKGMAEADGVTYTARLAGIFAGLPFTRSATYYPLEDVESVVEVEDADEAIDAGQLVIINDYGEPKIARAVNSKTTLSTDENDSIKSVAVVEALDMILEDINSTFKKTFIGRYKNNYQNESLLVASINEYFRQLALDEVLDIDFDNACEVDTESMRDAWISAGTAEASEWDDATTKHNCFRNKVFLRGRIKVLDAIEDLTFTITLA